MRFLRYLIFIIGIGILLFAVGLVVITKPVSPPPFLGAPENTVYVGSTTCLACHHSAHHYWDLISHTTIRQEIHAAVADGGAGEAVRMEEIGAGAYAYTLEVTPSVDSPGQQRPVMQTSAGYVILLRRRDNQDETSIDATLDNWLAKCVNCHVTGLNAEEKIWDKLSVPCENCHWSSSVYIKILR